MCEALENSPPLQRARSRSSSFFRWLALKRAGEEEEEEESVATAEKVGKGGLPLTHLPRYPKSPQVGKKRRPGLLNNLISFLVPKHQASPPFRSRGEGQ